ncbi:hypothetical protein [Luteolibacter sp. LG18]|uniref:hypothetical protein n=1 Tax=Luteolibacter sp. LG18 TaxID=2819286 RepID=UPI002B30EF72|nr:hypothetical protein llg_15590 [Luteolibacter sp. LG18]
MLHSADIAVCSQEQQDQLLQFVRLGQLFELMDWVEAGSPTLCPDYEKPRVKPSAIHEAVRRGNHSMFRFLWEKCWQRAWELDGLLSSVLDHGGNAACEIARFLIHEGFSLERLRASAVFRTHDDGLIRLALERGLSVRSPNGFACALALTGYSKHLIRLYRELREDYPDLVTEGLLALRDAVEDRKIRAAALLTWAGVDALKRIPSEPYEEESIKASEEEPDLISALDGVRLDEKTRDLLKALKVEVTEDVWFKFLDQAGWLDINFFADVYHWVPKPEEMLSTNPERAAKVATSLVRHLEGWDWIPGSASKQWRRLEVCEYLTWLGTPMLVAESDSDVRQFRRSLSKVSDSKAAVRILWLIHEKGDEAQRSRLREVIRTPAMQVLVRQHDRFLLGDLGLGPKALAKVKPGKRDRPWRLETYKPPTPCQKPPKVREEPRPPAGPTYYVSPEPAPARKGYWNRYSHFHRNG